MTLPIICIPRTLHNINALSVTHAFETIFGKGSIHRVDIIPLYFNQPSSPHFCKIFVHFSYSTSQHFLIKNRSSFNIVYDFPFFWKCSPYGGKPPNPPMGKPPNIINTKYINILQ